MRRTEEETQGHENAVNVTRNFVDSSKSIIRVSASIADIGTLEMDEL